MSDSSKDHEEEKVGAKTLLDNLWRARDFEINHLWQRSIFLATFLVVMFTAYFTQFNEITDKTVSIENVLSVSVEGIVNVKLIEENFEPRDTVVLIFICEIGFILSTLWIAMARGSKTAYERIEGGIDLFHDSLDGMFTADVDNLKRKMYFDCFEKPFEYGYFPRHGSLPVPWKINAKSSLKTGIQTGYFYSVSKINTALGYVFLVVWNILMFTSFKLNASWTTSFLRFFVLCLLNIFIFRGCNYLVLSDNEMTFRDYFSFIHKHKNYHSKEDGSFRRIENIRQFFFEGGPSEKDRVVETIVNKLRDDLASQGYSIDKELLSEFVEVYDNRANISERKQRSIIRQIWQGYGRTKEILEYEMMYRDSLPGGRESLKLKNDFFGCIDIHKHDGVMKLSISGVADESFHMSSKFTVAQEKIKLYFESTLREEDKDVFVKYRYMNKNSTFYIIIQGDREDKIKYISFHPIEEEGVSGDPHFSKKYKVQFFKSNGSEMKCYNRYFSVIEKVPEK